MQENRWPEWFSGSGQSIVIKYRLFIAQAETQLGRPRRLARQSLHSLLADEGRFLTKENQKIAKPALRRVAKTD
jgi:hypothetical protein